MAIPQGLESLCENSTGRSQFPNRTIRKLTPAGLSSAADTKALIAVAFDGTAEAVPFVEDFSGTCQPFCWHCLADKVLQEWYFPG
jgi:hypothetical protein